MALWQKNHHKSVILYSDRGFQYTSHEYQQLLKAHSIVRSMSATGGCYDNTAATVFLVY